MVNKAWLLKIKERGEKLKASHHASAAAVCDGNLPQLALNNGHLPLFPTITDECNRLLTNIIEAD